MNPRIITGTAKNKKLKVPESARPITDRIKQSVFDTLGERIKDAKVLDLFAGSGSIGIEALSRGAAEVTFVDDNYDAVGTLKDNLINTKFTTTGKVFRKDSGDFLKEARETFDLIFADPPFPTMHEFPVHLLLKVMTPESLVIFRKPAKAEDPYIPASLEVIYRQTYGESEVLYMQRKVQ